MASIKGIFETIAGVAIIAAGAISGVITFGAATPLSMLMISAGSGLIMNGVGTMMSGDPVKGFATATRNSIAAWRVLCGRVRTGGVVVYLHQWGSNNQILDMVIVLACHKCAIDSSHPPELLFDQQRIQIDTNAIPTSAAAGYSIPTPHYGSGTSFTPVQQAVAITHIARANDVVTVTLGSDIPYLVAGDQVQIRDITGDLTLNGIMQVAEITNAPASHVGGAVGAGGPGLTFTYLSGGTASMVDNEGHVVTRWPDYGRNVYVEYLDGSQALGNTFVGMTAGVPWQGTGKLCTPASPQNAGGSALPNPWTNYCSLQGKTAVFLRLQYDQTKFPSGLPQISFHLYGKNDIYDSRLGAYGASGTTGYTENPALIIADFLADTTWGYKAVYGTDIPLTQLSAAANLCDQSTALANGGTEPLFACNGQFELTMRRGEILQNLLTSCVGRLLYLGGQFIIQPAGWVGPGSPALQVNLTSIASGPFQWRPCVPIRELFNGVKGTYISPANKWQSTDFPYYAQDSMHGYSGPSGYGGDILLAADGGDRRWLELHLPFTISARQAQYTAKVELLRRRGRSGEMIGSTPSAGYGGTGTFALNLAGYQFAPLDVFEATVPFLEFANNLLEVAAVRFKADEQSGEGDSKVVRLGVEIDVQETDSSIYQWSAEEELSAQGYVQTRWPQATWKETAPLFWSPGYVAPLTGDALGGPANFGIQPAYATDAQGNFTAVSLQIKGVPPINALDESVAKPQLSCVYSATPGSLSAGTYVLALCAWDSGGSSHADSDYLESCTVQVGANGSIDCTFVWGSGDDGGDLYMALWTPSGYVFHFQQSIAPGTAGVNIGTFNQSTPGGPDDIFDHLAIQPQQVVHSGVWAQQVQAVTGTSGSSPGTITIADPTNSMTANQWAGYTLSLLAKFDAGQNEEIPILNMPVLSNTASSGGQFVITIGQNAAGAQLPSLLSLYDGTHALIEAGDLVVMRFNATFTANSFSDPNIANPYFSNGADGTGIGGSETGHVAMVLSGADTGDVQTIASVSVDTNGHYTIFQLAGQWVTTPTTGDIVIVCAPASVPEIPCAPSSSKNASISAVVAQPSVENLAGQVWVFLVRTEDVNGNSGPDVLAPRREVYFFGAGGTQVLSN